MHRAFVNPILNGEGEEKIAQNGRFFLIQVYTAQQHRFDPCVALIVYTDPTSLDLGKGSCDGVALPGLKINNNAVENSTECASTAFFYYRGFSNVHNSVSDTGPRFLVSSAEGQLNIHICSVYLVLGHNSQRS